MMYRNYIKEILIIQYITCPVSDKMYTRYEVFILHSAYTETTNAKTVNSASVTRSLVVRLIILDDCISDREMVLSLNDAASAFVYQRRSTRDLYLL